ncbi:MAG: formate/nitrite transporter family protein [Alphaproteobacteria bacterium]
MSEEYHPTGLAAYKPAEIARLIEAAGIAKAQLGLLPLSMLGMLAGAFIGFGGMFYLVVMTGAGDLFGPARLLGGIAFSLGLILVVVGGAELFTGNALIVMARIDGLISTAALLRNWAVVYPANLVGSLGFVAMIWAAGTMDLSAGAVGQTAARITEAKLALSPLAAFARGVLCNALVCLAIWLTFAAQSALGKIVCILWPITAFVALGFEHSVANMVLLPLGLLAGAAGTVGDAVLNLVYVTLGNIVGGAGGVAFTYWAIYLRGRPHPPKAGPA